MFDLLIGPLADLMLHLTHTLGGSFGLAVVAVSVTFRLAWLPFGVRFAVEARKRARAIEALKPQVEALREAHSEPLAQLQAVQSLYAEKGLNPRLGQMWPLLAQAPVLWGLFATVRRIGSSSAFLWIPSLARPDLALAGLGASLVGLAGWMNAETPSARAFAAIATVIFFVIATRMAASVGLLMATSAGVGALQAIVVRRRLAAG